MVAGSSSLSSYQNHISFLSKGCNFRDFRSLRAKLLWLTHTRPDISGAVALLVKIIEDHFDAAKEQCRLATNKIVRLLRKTPRCLVCKPLDLASARFVVYADAGEKHSQLGYVVTLQDDEEICHVLAFGSQKSSRVVTGAFSGEALALAHAFDVAFTLQHDFGKLMARTSIFAWTPGLFSTVPQRTQPRESICCLLISNSFENLGVGVKFPSSRLYVRNRT
jgi:hypothetical protein